MIIRARHGGDVEVRSNWPDHTYPPSRAGYGMSVSGQAVTVDTAGGIPAVGRAWRLVAGTIAAACIRVYQGEKGEKREQDADWRAELLENPVLGLSRFDWLWDIAICLESSANAFLLKRKSRGRVEELDLIPLHAVHGYTDRRTGEKLFDVDLAGGRQTLTTADVLHIRGETVAGGHFGVSRLRQHADPLGSILAAQTFEGSYFRNHARPDMIAMFPQGVTREQAAEWRPEYEAMYGGPENAGKIIPMGGGATMIPVPLSMRDAQFIESRTLSVEDTGRIVDVDPVLLGTEPRTDARGSAMNVFLRLQLPPRLTRITSALRADTDLFGRATPMYPEFHLDDLMFVDPFVRAQVEHERIQDGTALPDEIRAARGEPPIPAYPENPYETPGMIPQLTPVGGAPNPDPFPQADNLDSFQENSSDVVAEFRTELNAMQSDRERERGEGEVIDGLLRQLIEVERRRTTTVASERTLI